MDSQVPENGRERGFRDANAANARDPTPPAFFVKADSKGLTSGIGVKADSKGVAALRSEIDSR
jgi:hypothetical protein